MISATAIWVATGRPDFFRSSGPLRGIKRDLYDGGIRVPMIVRWPGTVKPGTVSPHISAFWDLLPTVCDLVGCAASESSDGVSFAPTLLGQVQEEHEYLYWEFLEQGGKQALRMGRWKAVRIGISKDENAPLELYDIESDPGEMKNVATSHPDVVARATAIFAAVAGEHPERRPFDRLKPSGSLNPRCYVKVGSGTLTCPGRRDLPGQDLGQVTYASSWSVPHRTGKVAAVFAGVCWKHTNAKRVLERSGR